MRASMGRPRRLSASFFAQEKAKLEHYRELKRTAGHVEVYSIQYTPSLCVHTALVSVLHQWLT